MGVCERRRFLWVPLAAPPPQNTPVPPAQPQCKAGGLPQVTPVGLCRFPWVTALGIPMERGRAQVGFLPH